MDDEEFKKLRPLIIPLIRKFVPKLVANEIVNVQPMTGNVGSIFNVNIGMLNSNGNLRLIRVTEKELMIRISQEGRIQGTDDIYDVTLSESNAKIINDWCKEHNLGKRMSHDMWQFESEEEILMFTLRWGGGKI